jgi:hypothetical protein
VQLGTLVFYAVAIGGLWLHRRREPFDGDAARVEKRELRLVGLLFSVLMALAVALSAFSQSPVLLGVIVPNFVVWIILGILLLAAALAAGVARL